MGHPARIACLLALGGALAACGSDGAGEDERSEARSASTTEVPAESSVLEDPGAGEASPEAGAKDGGESDLAPDDEAAVRAAAAGYVTALNGGDARAACALIVPGGLILEELPIMRGGCVPSLGASIGHRRPGGVPAWRRTEILDVTAVSVGGGRARLTATVTHRFADRNYRSVEEDVIYLEQNGGRWLLVKPSGTLYRAIGYPEPPLRAFAPPPS